MSVAPSMGTKAAKQGFGVVPGVNRPGAREVWSSEWYTRERIGSCEGAEPGFDCRLSPALRSGFREWETHQRLGDIVTTSLDEGFNQLKSHCDYFDFLFDIGELKNAPLDSLDTKYRNLAAISQDHESSDIAALELREELKVLSTLLKPGIGPKETLKFIGRHNFCPNVNIALIILLTLPVTVTSGERSFSKLELMKTYLRSTMSQTRLNDLATISIEHELAEDLNYTDRVKEFAQAKARKVRFV
ncbi:uncharacterized protein LOC126248411 [Schistocerca nitens]|uniref:uncharacterized protein LOC126248411 n=1 Tax=Schistocerca nitens TaxID=7011 RepID=UPI0021183E81|nr:uncharacterized protein LOC126248411 [Schistocerca nitens]